MQDPLQEIVPIKNRRAWRDLARILSTVFNPFITALALFVILAHASARGELDFWWLLGLSTFFTSIGPMIYVFWLYGSDRISDLDMSVRHEREAVFGAFVVFYLLGTVVMWLTHAPRIMIAAMAAYSLATLVVQYITRYWKISTHALGITAPFAVLTLLYGSQTLPFAVLIPMVGWARVYLKAHTLLQVIAGTALAIVCTVLFFHLFHVGVAVDTIGVRPTHQG
jgi:membrane-associated phospholipid phosphatase